jgi:hypothetical protein
VTVTPTAFLQARTHTHTYTHMNAHHTHTHTLSLFSRSINITNTRTRTSQHTHAQLTFTLRATHSRSRKPLSHAHILTHCIPTGAIHQPREEGCARRVADERFRAWPTRAVEGEPGEATERGGSRGRQRGRVQRCMRRDCARGCGHRVRAHVHTRISIYPPTYWKYLNSTS